MGSENLSIVSIHALLRMPKNRVSETKYTYRLLMSSLMTFPNRHSVKDYTLESTCVQLFANKPTAVEKIDPVRALLV